MVLGCGSWNCRFGKIGLFKVRGFAFGVFAVCLFFLLCAGAFVLLLVLSVLVFALGSAFIFGFAVVRDVFVALGFGEMGLLKVKGFA